jgi:hypothetical protein
LCVASHALMDSLVSFSIVRVAGIEATPLVGADPNERHLSEPSR